MEPIVSPWFIYLLSIINPLREGFVALAIVFGIMFFVGLIGYWVVKNDKDWSQEWLLVWKKARRASTVPFILFLFLSIFVPNRNALIAIYVTKFITTDNISKALDAGKDVKEEIKKDMLELIEAIKKDKAKLNN